MVTPQAGTLAELPERITLGRHGNRLHAEDAVTRRLAPNSVPQ
jgi:hypothetical protein